jgi:hypothetical protein
MAFETILRMIVENILVGVRGEIMGVNGDYDYRGEDGSEIERQ